MKIAEALKQRKSVRSYLDKAVEEGKIKAILDAARHAPSGVNTQPWQVAVVTGDTKKNSKKKLNLVNSYRTPREEVESFTQFFK